MVDSFTVDKLKRLQHMNCSQRERIDSFLEIISTDVNAKQIMMNIGLVDMDLLRTPEYSRMSGYELAQAAMRDIKIQTTMTDAVNIQVFGYNKLITPADLDNWIDEVSETTRLEKMLSDRKKSQMIGDDEIEREVKEKEMALDGVEDFYK
jgi:hypothetical protein